VRFRNRRVSRDSKPNRNRSYKKQFKRVLKRNELSNLRELMNGFDEETRKEIKEFKN
jgi:hypothetical protein